MANKQLSYKAERVNELLGIVDGLGEATTTEAGLMSAEDKAKLDSVEDGAEENVIVGVQVGGSALTPANKVINIPADSAPTSESTNLVRSGGVYAAIQQVANALLNYYTKAQVDALLAGVHQFTYQVVAELPDASADTMYILYFVPSSDPQTQNVKDEYITIRTGSEGAYAYSWERIGSTEIDLSDYPTTEEMNAAIATAVASKADKDDDAVEGNLAKFDANGNPVDAGIVAEKVAKKGEVQTFAGNLVDTRSAGTRQSFAFRQSGGDGVNYMRKILGRTEAFNQLVGPSDTQVTIPSGHLYYAIINGTASVGTSDGTPISVTGGTDIVVDLTLEGLGLTTADQFRALHPLPYYNYNAGVLKNNAATGLETTGLNQWDEEWEKGSIDSNGEPTTAASYQDRIRSKNFIPAFPNTVYYSKIPIGNMSVHYYDSNKSHISESSAVANATFTTPANCAYIKFRTNNIYGNVYNNDICINRPDASRNGTYEPYWKRDIVLGLDNLACHDENNNAVVVNGLDGVGTAQDELIVENGWGKKIIKRFAEVDLGDLAWDYNSQYSIFYANLPNVKNLGQGICSRYNRSSVTSASGIEDKSFNFSPGFMVDEVNIKDSAYTDAGAFKTAMDGVKLRFELATPKVLTLDNPIPALIEVDNLGTEKRLPEDTADNPQAPFECDSNYSISVANLVRKLNS